MLRYLSSCTVLALSVGLVAAQTPPERQLAIPGVIAADARIEVVRAGFQALEGPVGTPDGGLYFTDIRASRIYRLNPSGQISVWRENTNGTNGLFLLSDGRLLGAEMNGQRVVAMMADGSRTALATAFEGKPLRAPNDLIADKKGGVYFTDPEIPSPPNAPPTSRVYYIQPNGTLLLIDDQIPRPNGITLSLDETTLYVGDGLGEYVYAFDAQPDGGVRNKRPFAKLREPIRDAEGLRSRADGMAVDAEGRLYVATGAGVQVFDARGEFLGIIRVPSIVRNIAFAGPQRQVLYMTAADSLYRVRMIATGPPGRAK